MSWVLDSLLSAQRYMTSFTWWDREDILKSSSDRKGIVRLMSPHFPSPSYLPFPSCLVALLCFILASTASSFLHKMTRLSNPLCFLHKFFHLQMRCGTNASFSSACIWHGDSPSSVKQDDSTPLSLCQTCRCYPPCWWKWGVFTSLGRIGGLAMSCWA